MTETTTDATATVPPVCPCCAGETTGDWFDLCELCTTAAVDGIHPHGCARPSDRTVTESTTTREDPR